MKREVMILLIVFLLMGCSESREQVIEIDISQPAEKGEAVKEQIQPDLVELPKAEYPMITAEDFKADLVALDEVLKSIRTTTTDVDVYSSQLNTIKELEAENPNELSLLEAYRKQNSLVVRMFDPNTYLVPSEQIKAQMAETGLFPLSLLWLEDQLYVATGNADSLIPAYAQIKKINGLETAWILQIMTEALAGNDSYKQWLLLQNFPEYYHLFVDDSTVFEVEYIDVNGEKGSATIGGVQIPAEELFRLDIPFPLSVETEQKEYRGEHYMIMRFPDLSRTTEEQVQDQIKKGIMSANNGSIPTLLLDFRGNSILSQSMIQTILPYFLESEILFYEDKEADNTPIQPGPIRYKGAVYIYTDGSIQGEMAQLIGLLRENSSKVKLVGTTLGGGYLNTVYPKQLLLEHSGDKLIYCAEERISSAMKAPGAFDINPDYLVTQALLHGDQKPILERKILDLLCNT